MPTRPQQNVTVEYAGSIAGRTHDETLTELASHGAFLTKISVGISDPSAISSDFEFAGAPNDDPYQQVVYRNKDVDLMPVVLVGGLLLVVAVVIVAVVLVVVLRSPRSAAK